MMGFVFRLIPPRPDFTTTMSDEERATMEAHGRYWTSLMTQGQVLAFGPVRDPAGPYGIGIVLAEDLAEAETLADRDPVAQMPHPFLIEVAPMAILVSPGGTYEGSGPAAPPS